MSELNVYKHIRYATAWRCFCSRNLLYGIIFVAVMVQIKNDMIKIHQFTEADTIAARDIWNTVVRDGLAFPQDEELTMPSSFSNLNHIQALQLMTIREK